MLPMYVLFHCFIVVTYYGVMLYLYNSLLVGNIKDSVRFSGHTVSLRWSRRYFKKPQNHNRLFAEIVQICQPTLDGNKVDSLEFINSLQLWRLLWSGHCTACFSLCVHGLLSPSSRKLSLTSPMHSDANPIFFVPIFSRFLENTLVFQINVLHVYSS